MQFPKPEHKPSKFGRQQYVGQPAAPVTRSKRSGKVVRCDDAAPVQVKSVPKRCPALLKMAKGQPCYLRVPGVCKHQYKTVVACHSNLSIHGKAGARKADDCYVVYGCSACHAWLDQGPAPAAEKERVFMAAHIDMVTQWRATAWGWLDATPAERKAARWALEQLNASPVGEGF